MLVVSLLLFCRLGITLNVLITGGTGYIGSHTAVELLEAGHRVILVDNLSNSRRSVVESITAIAKKGVTFYQADCTDQQAMERIFQKCAVQAVIHMAGFKAVSESVRNPLRYYKNNILSSITLLEVMKKYHVHKIVFSSSATVYGMNVQPGCLEQDPVGNALTNPYGKTKFMIEELLADYALSDPSFEVAILRYFNPIGAHPSGLLGENPRNEPTNLMPVILRVFRGELPYLEVYGNNYSTPDGSCIRDYIHVVDLARGHIAALDNIHPGVSIFNLGTGTGVSVFELITAFEKISRSQLPIVIGSRRKGDVSTVYANVSKAAQELHWIAHLTIQDAIADVLRYHQSCNTHRVDVGSSRLMHQFVSVVCILLMLSITTYLFCRFQKQQFSSSSFPQKQA